MRSLGPALVATEVSAGARKDIATAIVNLDPTHEEASCYLMQEHAEQGDVAGALRIYKALWDLLDEDYGMEPSAATQDLVAKIKLGEFEQPRAGIDVRQATETRLSPSINGSIAKAIAPVAEASRRRSRSASCCSLLR